MASPNSFRSANRNPRSTARLTLDRTFGPWFWGNLVSNSGNWLFNVTAAVVVFQLSRSVLLVGLVSVAQFGPLVLLSPLAGALSDRMNRRVLLLTAQTVSASAATALGIAVVAGGVEGLPGTWPILATALGIGVGQAFSGPSLHALVPALVDDVDLESAVALTTLTFNIGRALGPATSGVLLATVGLDAAFIVNALSFTALIGALLSIHPHPRPKSVGTDRSVRAGLRYVRNDRITLLLLGGVSATGFAVDPMITIAPPLADVLGGSETLAAVLVTSFGVAAAPSAAISAAFQRAIGSVRVAQVGIATLVLGLAISAVSQNHGTAIIGFAITGAGFVFALTGFTTALQRRVADQFRGRVMSLWTIAFLGTRPLAALVDGAAADRFGPRWAMSIPIAVALGGGWAARRLRRRFTEEDLTRLSPLGSEVLRRIGRRKV